MKLKDVSALLRSGRTIIISEGRDCQWIGDGSAAYPMYGLPAMKKENLPVLLDIPESKQDSYTIQNTVLPFSEDDNTLNEYEITDLKTDINYRGVTLSVFVGSGRLFFVKPKYLKPLGDMPDRRYFARISNGTYAIAVKEGFFLRAVIMPFVNIVDEDFVAVMKTIYSLSADILISNKEELEKQEEQASVMNMTEIEEE